MTSTPFSFFKRFSFFNGHSFYAPARADPRASFAVCRPRHFIPLRLASPAVISACAGPPALRPGRLPPVRSFLAAAAANGWPSWTAVYSGLSAAAARGGGGRRPLTAGRRGRQGRSSSPSTSVSHPALPAPRRDSRRDRRPPSPSFAPCRRPGGRAGRAGGAGHGAAAGRVRGRRDGLVRRSRGAQDHENCLRRASVRGRPDG